MSTTRNAATPTEPHNVVSREQWLAARRELLGKEKEFTRQYDALTALERDLPWVKVEKEYVFDAPQGKLTLSDRSAAAASFSSSIS